MSNEDTKKKTTNEEIDLFDLMQKTGNSIRKIFNYILNLTYKILLFFIRRYVLIGIITIIFIAFGVVRYKTTTRLYSSSMEAISNAMPSIDMINYINNISTLFENEDKEGVQNLLGLSKEEMDEIISLKAYKVLDYNKDGVKDKVDFEEDFLPSDTLVSMSKLVVRIIKNTPNRDQDYQEKLIDYINKNKYITNINSIRRKQLKELVIKYGTEIDILDSLQKKEYFTKKEKISTQAGQLLIMNEKDIPLYHDKIISMYKEKQNIEKTLELQLYPLTIIQDLSGSSKIENDIMSYLKLYGILGFFLSVILAIIIEKFTLIKKVINDSKVK